MGGGWFIIATGLHMIYVIYYYEESGRLVCNAPVDYCDHQALLAT